MNLKSFKYRTELIKNLKEFNTKFGKQLEQKILIADIDSIFKYIRCNEKTSKKLIEKHLNNEFAMSSVYLTSLSSIAVALIEEEGDKNSLFPPNWFNYRASANPNYIFGNFVIQIANYTLAIINLLQQGLNTPAKSLIRIHNDLILQSLVLLFDKEIFSDFCLSANLEDPTSTWFRVFARGKLNKKISDIETKIGLDKNATEQFKKWRKETQKFYSNVIHHSFENINFGAMAIDFESKDIQPALLGLACSTSKQTIDILNYNVYYFLELFIQITSKIHMIRLNTKNPFGYIGVISSLIYRDIFLKHYFIKT